MTIQAFTDLYDYVTGPLFDATVGSVARNIYPISRPGDLDYQQAVQDRPFFFQGRSLYMTLARYNQLSLSAKVCKASTVLLTAGTFGACSLGLPWLAATTYFYQASWPLTASFLGIISLETPIAFACLASEQYIPKLQPPQLPPLPAAVLPVIPLPAAVPALLPGGIPTGR